MRWLARLFDWRVAKVRVGRRKYFRYAERSRRRGRRDLTSGAKWCQTGSRLLALLRQKRRAVAQADNSLVILRQVQVGLLQQRNFPRAPASLFPPRLVTFPFILEHQNESRSVFEIWSPKLVDFKAVSINVYIGVSISDLDIGSYVFNVIRSVSHLNLFFHLKVSKIDQYFSCSYWSSPQAFQTILTIFKSLQMPQMPSKRPLQYLGIKRDFCSFSFIIELSSLRGNALVSRPANWLQIAAR